MLSKAYPHPEERPKGACLEGRKTVMQPFLSILAQPLRCSALRSSTACRRLPDAAFLHQPDLAVDHLPLVFGMPAGGFVEIEVLRIDRLLIDDLRQFGANVLVPVGHLRR